MLPGALKTTQFLGVLAVSCAAVIMGFSASYTGTALLTMEQESVLDLDTTDISWIVSILSLGGCIGSAIGGPLIDLIGRKWTILATGVPFISAYLLIGCAYRVWMVVTGRFIAGLCTGINSTAIPIFLGEILDANIRGTFGIIPTAMGNGGVLLAYLAGYFCDWRELAYLGSVLPVAYIILTIVIKESPRYYASKNRMEDARDSLLWYRKNSRRAMVVTEYREIVKNARESAESTDGFITELFKPQNLHPFLLVVMLMTIQQFSGVNAMIAYIGVIFKSAPIPLSLQTSSMLFGVINFCAVFMAIPLIDRKGRKFLLYLSDLCMIWTLLLFGAYFFLEEHHFEAAAYLNWLPIVCALFYILGFSFGFGPVPWLMMGEILPVSIRGFGAGLLASYNWLCSWIVQLFFLYLRGSIGTSGTMWLFASFCVAGFFSIVLIPETKGKSLEIIEAELMNDESQAGFMETMEL